MFSKKIAVLLFLSCSLLLFWQIPQAAAHIEKGSMPDAVAEMEYRILLEFEPDNFEIRNQLGMVLYRSGKLAEAENEFGYILERVPENFDAMDGLGLVYLKQGKYQLAIDLLKKAITINPDDLLVYLHLGQTLEELGKIPEAAEIYRKGLSRKEPGNDTANNDKHRQALLDALKNIQEKAGTTREMI